MSSIGKAFSSEKLLSWATSEFAILSNVFYPICDTPKPGGPLTARQPAEYS